MCDNARGCEDSFWLSLLVRALQSQKTIVGLSLSLLERPGVLQSFESHLKYIYVPVTESVCGYLCRSLASAASRRALLVHLSLESVNTSS